MCISCLSLFLETYQHFHKSASQLNEHTENYVLLIKKVTKTAVSEKEKCFYTVLSMTSSSPRPRPRPTLPIHVTHDS